MRLPIPSVPGIAVLVALGIIVATAGLTAFANGPVPHVDLTVSVPPDGRLPSGGIASLLVTLSPSNAAVEPRLDRKSTRLNSSHRCTSYAVFCVQKTARCDPR